MDQGCEGSPTEFAKEVRECIIELEQTDAQGLKLSRRGVQSPIVRRVARSDFICDLTLATAVVIAMGAAIVWQWIPANHLPPAPAVASPALVVFPPVTVAEPEGRPPVQVKNPWDGTEVFEFPAGTSETEARETVAALLLQRARNRRG